MRAVCFALFLATITYSSGCIPVGSSGPKAEGEANKAGAEAPQKGKAEASDDEGSVEAGRKYFDGQMSKWMAGDISGKVSLIVPPEYLENRPLKYDVLSVVTESPNIYRYNVSVTFESRAGIPVPRVVIYMVMWNPNAKEWSALRKSNG